MNSLGVFLLFALVIYITIVYSNKKFNINKEFVIVKKWHYLHHFMIFQTTVFNK